MIQGFIDNSEEPELSVERVYSMMNEMNRDDCQFYGIYEGGDDPVGYLFAQVMPDEYGDDIILVQSSYVKPGTKTHFWIEMEEHLYRFAKKHGCDVMYFTTRRNPKAFARLLRTSWTLDSHVLKHVFSKEPCRAS